MRVAIFTAAFAAMSFPMMAQAKAVFAHYMVGTITQAHAQTDIDNAIGVGLDGFALNIGDPTQAYVTNALSYLFPYAASRNFKLFASCDMYASLGSGKSLSDYAPVLNQYMSSSAWYKGPNNLPFLSTFSDGSLTNTQWNVFKSSLNNGNGVYFVPDFDGTQGYSTADPGWWSYWGGVVDGLFSWESAWPAVGSSSGAGSVTQDTIVANGAKSRSKTYMIALSALQYKNSYGTNLYRLGGLNLPNRMANILTMSPSPDFVEIITWNDGPESHYIGNNWPESNGDPAPAKYMGASHTAWQPLITSFIKAYKASSSPSTMSPTTASPASGAIWYKRILQSSTCPSDSQPAGFSTGTDAINWAVVLAAGLNGYKVRIISNGAVLATTNLVAGLNMGEAFGVQAGGQSLQLLNADGGVVMTAGGGAGVSAGCPDGVYNMNYQVVGLA